MIILNNWIDFGYVPSPAEVSNEEGIDIFKARGEISLSYNVHAFWASVKPMYDFNTQHSPLKEKDHYAFVFRKTKLAG